MSVQAMAWVLEHSDSTLGARLVLLAIAGHADREGRNSWASVRSLSEEAHLSERQTRYALRLLEKNGEIRENGKTRRGTHVYELPMMGGAVSATEGGNPRHEGGQPTAPEPSKEPSKTLERARDSAFDALAEATGVDLGSLTASAARTIGVKLAEIRNASMLAGVALAEEIELRAQRYRRKHPTWDLTPAALAKHWPELGPENAGHELRSYDMRREAFLDQHPELRSG